MNLKGADTMLPRQRLTGLLILVALVLSACQPVVAQPEAMPAQSDEDVSAAVDAIWQEYAAAVVAGDADRWIAQWTDDGVQMPPGEPLVEGKENIYARVSAVMAAGPTDEFVITPLETTGAGDWAYSRGTYVVTFPLGDTGEQGTIDGKFMTILQRQPDGSWKIHRDIFNSNVPPAAAEETDVEAVTASVLATWDEYEASTLTNDADRRLALWADDGVILRPGKAPVEGKAAIDAAVRGGFSGTTFKDFTIDNVEVEASGDLAFARGTYTVDAVNNATGDPIYDDGTYMSIFKRQADGSWKLYRDMTHSNIPPAPPTNVNDVTDAINGVWREYEASQLAGDPDRWIALWAEDGVQLPPGSPPVVGREAIDARDRADLAANDYSEFTIDNQEVEVNGDLAFSRGNYAVTVAAKSGGDPMHFEGKYMTIFRQQPDGTWKIYRDTFNSIAP
jgi:uncharacterized protein (TIGR02246 family)